MNNRLHSYFQFQISIASLDEIRIRIASIMQYYERRYLASQYRLRDAIDQIFYFHSPVFTYHRILLIDCFGQHILRLSWFLSFQFLQLRSQLHLFTKTYAYTLFYHSWRLYINESFTKSYLVPKRNAMRQIFHY